MGYDFTGGSNFPFSYWFLHGPYNSAAQIAACDCQIFFLNISFTGDFSKTAEEISSKLSMQTAAGLE